MFNWIKPKTPPSAPPGSRIASNAPQHSKKDQMIAEAMAHAKTAREAIGEETLAKVRDLMQKQQQAQQKQKEDAGVAAKKALKSLAPHVHTDDVSPMEQAKKILLSMEPEKLAQHLRLLREEDKKLN